MLHFYSRFLFIVGFLIGILLAVLFVIQCKPPNVSTNLQTSGQLLLYEKWFKQTKMIRKEIPFDKIRYTNESYYSESQFLYDKIKILCLVLVNNEKNVVAARNTWLKGCNLVETVNLKSRDNGKLPTMKRTRENASWVLLCDHLRTVPRKFDWIVVVYDYVFVILENLRLILASLDSVHAHYFGHAVQFWGTAYNLGQAGYVLSRGTIRQFKRKFNDTDACKKDPVYHNREDYYLGRYLFGLNITPVDTSDGEGCTTFHPYNWYHVFNPGENYYKNSIYPNKCSSPYSITFQAIEAHKMYYYYYILYTLQVFNDGQFGNKARPIKSVNEEDVWKNFLRERNITTNLTAMEYYMVWENFIDDPTSFARHMKREEYFDYN